MRVTIKEVTVGPTATGHVQRQRHCLPEVEHSSQAKPSETAQHASQLASQLEATLKTEHTAIQNFKDFIYLLLERERNINVWLPLMQPPLGTWPAT